MFLGSGFQLGNEGTFVDEPKTRDYTDLPALGEMGVNPLGQNGKMGSS